MLQASSGTVRAFNYCYEGFVVQVGGETASGLHGYTSLCGERVG